MYWGICQGGKYQGRKIYRKEYVQCRICQGRKICLEGNMSGPKVTHARQRWPGVRCGGRSAGKVFLNRTLGGLP